MNIVYIQSTLEITVVILKIKKSTQRAQICDNATHYHKQTNTTENIICLLEITICEPQCVSSSLPGIHGTNPSKDKL